MTSVQPSARQKHSYTPAQIGHYILGVSFLRNILIAFLLVALLFPLYSWLYLTPAYRNLLTRLSEDEARRTAVHLMRTLEIGVVPLNEAVSRADMLLSVAELKTDFQLRKLKLFDPDGRVIFSTDPQEAGTVNQHAYFIDKVAKGHIHSHLVKSGGLTLERAETAVDVVEIYVPIMLNEAFMGAFEIYYDISAAQSQLAAVQQRSHLTMLIIALCMLAIAAVILFKAGSAMLAHREMDHALHKARHNLERRVKERTRDLIESHTALGESESRYRMLVETIPDGIREIDTRGIITFVNPAHAKLYGHDDGELTGTSMFDLTADETERRQLKDHLAFLVEQQPHPSPWFGRDRTRDGRLIDVQVDWRYKTDGQGQVIGLITVISDITHRKKAERALLDNIEFLNTLIDTIPNPVFYKDDQGIFLGCNAAYAQTIGLSKNAILGRRLIDLGDISFKDRAEAFHRQDLLLVASPGIQHQEERLVTADGRTRDFMLFKATFNDAEGRAAGLVGIMLDITARTEAEQRRQQLERQLLQAQKMEALGTLAGGVAHDFNNILAAIIGYTQIVISDMPPETTQHDYLKRVLEAGERAEQLVKQILTFSRRNDAEPTPMQIKTIVKEVLKLVRATLPATVKIEQRLESDAFIKADPVQIHQVMMNLCANAGYAMQNGGGKLTVVLEAFDVDDAFIRRHPDIKPGFCQRLTVSDTGTGIAPEDLNRVFDPFFTTKPKGEGTGMGLSVVHGIVAALNGIVTVESTPGQGARFDLYFPIVEGHQPAAAAKPPAKLPTGKERILFVDDEVFQTDMLKHMLGLLGYKVETCNSSPQALERVRETPDAFDLVLTDMVMPGMTGDDLARQLLKIRPDLPIILCTGYTENMTEEKALALGIRAFTLKPLAMERLSVLIRQVLDETGGKGKSDIPLKEKENRSKKV